LYITANVFLPIAKLFDVETPAITTAKVLELGCASGGNILPLAVRYPNAQFVGIDLSEKQILDGCADIEALNLSNIQLKCMSISDITKDFGEFDYIICHGVFSWVPENVQHDIMRVCNENLSQNGLAYISYNTLPGWSIVSALREMMKYHTQNFSDPKQKVEEAIKMLQFTLANQAQDSHSPWKEAIESELKNLNGKKVSYFLHEHLEDNNNPKYFHEVAALASEYNLQYLGETSLPAMYLGNMSELAQQNLGTIRDIVQQEQYMDFVRNRRFRQTIFCHKGIKINRNINREKIFDFALSVGYHVKPDFNPALDKFNDINTTRTFCNGFVQTTSHILALTLCILAERPGCAMAIEDIITEMQLRNNNLTEQEIRNTLATGGLDLVMKNILNLHLKDELIANIILSDKPEIWSYSRHQIVKGKQQLTNLYHENINIDIMSSILFTLIDGTRTKEEITQELKSKINELGLKIKSKDGSEAPTLDEYIENFANTTFENLNHFKILVK
jgi:methyltransferase-like protein